MEQGTPSSASDSPLVDFDAICQKLRAALEPVRTHAISLHDEHGDVLWLSESSMGPDEHNAVREAIEGFAKPSAAPVLAFDLGDSRSALMIRAINARRAMVGLVMVVVDSRGIAQGPARVMTPKLQRVLMEFAGTRADKLPAVVAARVDPVRRDPVRKDPVRRDPAPIQKPTPPPRRDAALPAPSAAAVERSASGPPPPSPQRSAPTSRPVPAQGPVILTRRVVAEPSVAAPRPTAAVAPTATTAGPKAAVAAARPAGAAAAAAVAKSVTPEIDRLHAALRKSPIALYVQRLVPLSKGGRLKRYEVLLRSKSDNAPNSAPHAMLKTAVENGLGSMIDRRVLTELISWLVHHADSWHTNEVMFSVNLTSTALHDEHFIKFVELCMAKSSLPKGTIAFEVDAPTALTLADKISDVADALHRLGCPLILDDFALRTECFALLRLPGVRYIKLSAEITAKMRTDKLSQAAITGVVQMARVLGMHTVAKRTETAAEREWLTALGVDFVQSNTIAPPVSIDTLAKPAAQLAKA